MSARHNGFLTLVSADTPDPMPDHGEPPVLDCGMLDMLDHARDQVLAGKVTAIAVVKVYDTSESATVWRFRTYCEQPLWSMLVAGVQRLAYRLQKEGL